MNFSIRQFRFPGSIGWIMLAFCLPKAGWPATDWPTVGGDLTNTRHSTLSQINVSNVKALLGAWQVDLAAPSRTPPVVVDGVLYVNDASAIYAFSARSGEPLWRYQPEHAAPARGGVAVAGGLVYCGLSDARIVALDGKSGKPIWTGYIGNAPQGGDLGESVTLVGVPTFNNKVGTIVNAPTYVDGIVISGLSGGDGGARGKIAALDGKTGKLLWNFYVIPSPDDAAAETWPRDGDALKRGGGAVWTQGAADAKLGLVYYGTGNPVPQLGGEIRGGDNRYTDSVVALDIKTGKLRWAYQLTHHDLWEMDVSTPVILYPTRVNGQKRDALAVARTDGYLFFLDRETGVPIRAAEERPVRQDERLRTAATQPFPVHGERLGPTCVDPLTAPRGFELGCWFDPPFPDKANVLYPIINARQAPMSYDPGSGYFYLMASANPIWYRRTADPNALLASRPPGSSEYGLYAAIDSKTDRVVWQKRSLWGLAGGSGALTTAGGLLLHAEGDGNIQADNLRNGETLWKFQLGSIPVAGGLAFSGGVPFASYAVGGEQFIAVVSNTSLWAFSLHGVLGSRVAPPPPPQSVGFSGIVHRLPNDGTGEIIVGAGETLVQSGAGGNTKANEDGFTPIRSQVESGAMFKWSNHGTRLHTVVAADGSWTTGPISPGQSVSLSIAKPGTYAFWSVEFPWSQGQLIVR